MDCPYCGSDDTSAVFGGFTCRQCRGTWKPMFAGAKVANPQVTYESATKYLEGTR